MQNRKDSIMHVTINLIQRRPNKKTNEKGNPKQLIPAIYGYDPKVAQAFLTLLDREFLTLDDINNLRQINITFNLVESEVPISGEFRHYENCFIWHDKSRKRYYGRQLDHRGYLSGKSATSSSVDGVYRKLVIDEWYKEPTQEQPAPSLEEIKATAQQRRENPDA